MTVTVLSIILFIVFTALGAIHLYWLFGGKWGVKKVIPTKKGMEDSSIPIPRIATLVVAVILIAIGFIYLIKSGLIAFSIPNWIIQYGYWIIPIIFILRAIGEFNYVGFFKKVKNTDFAEADTKWFSPLCLIIGIIGIVIQVLA